MCPESRKGLFAVRCRTDVPERCSAAGEGRTVRKTSFGTTEDRQEPLSTAMRGNRFSFAGRFLSSEENRTIADNAGQGEGFRDSGRTLPHGRSTAARSGLPPRTGKRDDFFAYLADRAETPPASGPPRRKRTDPTKFRAQALTTHFSKFRHYECHLHRRAGMDFARRKTGIPRGDGPSGGENVRSGRTGRLNRLAGCLPGARHRQTHVAVLPGKRPFAVLPYRGKVFLPPKRRRSLSRSEDRTASCGTSHLSFH